MAWMKHPNVQGCWPRRTREAVERQDVEDATVQLWRCECAFSMDALADVGAAALGASEARQPAGGAVAIARHCRASWADIGPSRRHEPAVGPGAVAQRRRGNWRRPEPGYGSAPTLPARHRHLRTTAPLCRCRRPRRLRGAAGPWRCPSYDSAPLLLRQWELDAAAGHARARDRGLWGSCPVGR